MKKLKAEDLNKLNAAVESLLASEDLSSEIQILKKNLIESRELLIKKMYRLDDNDIFKRLPREKSAVDCEDIKPIIERIIASVDQLFNATNGCVSAHT